MEQDNAIFVFLVVDQVFVLFNELANEFANFACGGGVGFFAEVEKPIPFQAVNANDQLGIFGFFLVFFLASHSGIASRN